jgi:hypothetical protein
MNRDGEEIRGWSRVICDHKVVRQYEVVSQQLSRSSSKKLWVNFGDGGVTKCLGFQAYIEARIVLPARDNRPGLELRRPQCIQASS